MLFPIFESPKIHPNLESSHCAPGCYHQNKKLQIVALKCFGLSIAKEGPCHNGDYALATGMSDQEVVYCGVSRSCFIPQARSGPEKPALAT